MLGDKDQSKAILEEQEKKSVLSDLLFSPLLSGSCGVREGLWALADLIRTLGLVGRSPSANSTGSG